MSQKVFLVDYAKRVGFTIPVLAETEDEAQDAADKLIADGVFIPSREVAYMLDYLWCYDEPSEISVDNLEDVAEEYGMIYRASDILKETTK